MDAPHDFLSEKDIEEGYSAQVWLFGGTRVDPKGRKAHAWLPAERLAEKGIEYADELSWDPKGETHCIIGGEYWVRAKYDADAGTWWRRTRGMVYRGLHSDTRIRAILSARHQGAETAIKTKRLLDADKKDSPLEEALTLIQEAYHNVTYPHRAAFLAYVTRRITHGGK